MLDLITRIDSRLARRLVALTPGPVKSALGHLSNSANLGRLWFVVGAVQALAGGRAGRRAAQRGLLSLGVASFLANAVLKPLLPRPRPPVDPTALPGIVARPKSSSFPSGHSASAVAYAVASAMEAPKPAAPIAALAAGVAVSRVTSGVHYPSDIAAGAAVGAFCAWGSTWAWPLVDDSPADAEVANRRSQRRLDAVSDRGAGLVVVANASAGQGRAGSDVERLAEALPDARIVEADPDADLIEVMTRAADGAAILGVLGGDGSISAAASVAADRGVPLAVFPGGTLNHFARDLGIDSLDDAVDALRAGHVASVDLGVIELADGTDRPFVNTASFGTYSEFVEARERLEHTVGKWPAMASALVTVLARGEPTQVRIDGQERAVWMIFIGNGAYDPPGFAPATRGDLADGMLDVRIVDGGRPGSRIRLIAALASGRLGRSRTYRRDLVRSLDVDFGEPVASLAADGEVFEGTGRFTVGQRPHALEVIVPGRPQ